MSCSSQLLKKWKHVLKIFHLSKGNQKQVDVRGNTQTPECVVVAIKSNCTLRMSSYNFKSISGVRFFSSQEDSKHTKNVDNSETGGARFREIRKKPHSQEKKNYCRLPSTGGRQFLLGLGTDAGCEREKLEFQTGSVMKCFKHYFNGKNWRLYSFRIKKIKLSMSIVQVSCWRSGSTFSTFFTYPRVSEFRLTSGTILRLQNA